MWAWLWLAVFLALLVPPLLMRLELIHIINLFSLHQQKDVFFSHGNFYSPGVQSITPSLQFHKNISQILLRMFHKCAVKGGKITCPLTEDRV